MLLFFDTETNGLWRRDLNPDHEDQPRLPLQQTITKWTSHAVRMLQ